MTKKERKGIEREKKGYRKREKDIERENQI